MPRCIAFMNTSWEGEWKWEDPDKMTFKELFQVKSIISTQMGQWLKPLNISGLGTEVGIKKDVQR